MKSNNSSALMKSFVLFTALAGVVLFVYAIVVPGSLKGHVQVNVVPNIQVPVESIPLVVESGKPSQQIAAKPVSFSPASLHPTAKIQAAILLDVSNSMDGLIEQAKAQLWNMVSVMGQVRCDGLAPSFELALYEYGRPDNGSNVGYIKQLKSFTSNLDSVSSLLFSLNTNGGDEYCPQVIVNSVDDLGWDGKPTTYRVIFIAGNESFRQGRIPWTAACEKARQKEIIVNTIYCGSRDEGIMESWNLGAECGKGSYTNINQDAEMEDIPTPYDTTLFALNEKLNATYVAYGIHGNAAALMQADVDTRNYAMSKSAAAKRVEVKGKKELYRNDSWDMVDAMETDKAIVSKLDKEALPDSLKNKSQKEIETMLNKKKAERALVQKQIAEVSVKRNNYISNERAAKASAGSDQTLESEIEKIIRAQVQRFNMKVQ